MANNGARTFGNFDEIMGCFGQHGIFQNRSKVTECKELRDMLRLYNGDDLRRETGKSLKSILILLMDNTHAWCNLEPNFLALALK